MSGLATVDYAAIRWEDDGTPRSLQFNDIYFSRDGGLAESTHVYLDGNRIPERWPAHFQQHAAFHLFEAGFGTGLNFLLTLRAFLANAPSRDKRLRYVAVEQFPLHPTDLRKALSYFPELASLTAQLLAQYPQPLRGWHSLHFAERQVELLLIYDDIANTLPALRQTTWRFDAWYFDGFAPARNESMWAETLWPAIQRLSRSGATASTFSAAGSVRRGLQSAEFEVEKAAGFGRKRDMTRAVYVGYAPPSKSLSPHTTSETNADPIIIVGAGIAGATMARALAERGLTVTVLEQQPNAGGTLRHHDMALASPRWSRDHNIQTRFQLMGFLQLKHWAEQFDATGNNIIQHRGILHVLDEEACEREHLVLTELGFLNALAETNETCKLVEWWDAKRASSYAGVPITHTTVKHHLALALAPQLFCHALLEHPNITTLYSADMRDYSARDDGVAVYLSDDRVLQGAHLILATGVDSTRWLNPNLLRPVRGQRTLLPQTETSAQLKVPLRFGRYLTPAQQGIHTLGASYDGGLFDPALRAESQQENLDSLAQALPALVSAWQSLPVTGDVGHRVVTLDRSPLIGAHPIQLDPTQPKVWLNLAHGSHALMTACAGAQLLVSLIVGEPASFPADHVRAASPARYRHYFTAT